VPSRKLGKAGGWGDRETPGPFVPERKVHSGGGAGLANYWAGSWVGVGVF